MANIYKLSSVCRVCFGTGVELSGQPDGQGGIIQTEQPCVSCGATGETEGMSLDLTDLEDKIDKIKKNVKDVEDKCDAILEILNS